jgi:hypothetical protein
MTISPLALISQLAITNPFKYTITKIVWPAVKWVKRNTNSRVLKGNKLKLN